MAFYFQFLRLVLKELRAVDDDDDDDDEIYIHLHKADPVDPVPILFRLQQYILPYRHVINNIVYSAQSPPTSLLSSSIRSESYIYKRMTNDYINKEIYNEIGL